MLVNGIFKDDELMMTALLQLIGGFIVLMYAADRFVISIAGLGRYYQINPCVVGIVFVGFATAMPELMVSLAAAYKGAGHMAMGNAIGSYITNITLVLGASVLVCPLLVHRSIVYQEQSIMFMALILSWALVSDGVLSRADAMILISSFGAYVLFLWYSAKHQSKAVFKQLEASTSLDQQDLSIRASWVFMILGFVLMMLAVDWITQAAMSIATILGIAEWIIGLSIVAIGTSLPELAASMMAAYHGEHDIAFGNVIGSNIIGLLGVLAMPGMIKPGKIPQSLLDVELPLMLFVTLMLMLGGKRRTDCICFNRWFGGLLVLIFLGYIIWLIIEAMPHTS